MYKVYKNLDLYFACIKDAQSKKQRKQLTDRPEMLTMNVESLQQMGLLCYWRAALLLLACATFLRCLEALPGLQNVNMRYIEKIHLLL